MSAEPICRAPGAPRLVLLLAVFSLAGFATWAEAHGSDAAGPDRVSPAAIVRAVGARIAPEAQRRLVWRGSDVDGDGQADFANPTGRFPRLHDAFGDGGFHAVRDGGTREHEGVDYVAEPGQAVTAPMSGYVTRIGYAYPGDSRFQYVEISNPALGYVSRVFYVDPQVREGQAVRIGAVIGAAHSLQRRYRGITDHVHLEIARLNGRKLDATRLITASYEPAPAASGGPGGPRVLLK